MLLFFFLVLSHIALLVASLVVASNIFFRTTRELEYFFFQNSILGYMTKSLNQIFFFFLHQNQNNFFSNIGNQNICLGKIHTYICKATDMLPEGIVFNSSCWFRIQFNTEEIVFNSRIWYTTGYVCASLLFLALSYDRFKFQQSHYS